MPGSWRCRASEFLPGSVRVFEELVKRLKARRTETPEKLELRLAMAREELRQVDIFDYYVVNAENQLEQAVDTVLAIIHSEHRRTNPRQVQL